LRSRSSRFKLKKINIYLLFIEFEDRKKGFLERFSDHQGALNFFLTLGSFYFFTINPQITLMITFSLALRPSGPNPSYKSFLYLWNSEKKYIWKISFCCCCCSFLIGRAICLFFQGAKFLFKYINEMSYLIEGFVPLRQLPIENLESFTQFLTSTFNNHQLFFQNDNFQYKIALFWFCRI
jgi:hypothetical protein